MQLAKVYVEISGRRVKSVTARKDPSVICFTCPECSRNAQFKDQKRSILDYKCSSGHVIQVDVSGEYAEIISVQIPHIPLKTCPKCGRTKLEKVHNQLYPEQDGVYRFVIYRCPVGHETKERQLELREFNVPPKELWEGWQ